MIEVPIDDYERALAVLSELADEAENLARVALQVDPKGWSEGAYKAMNTVTQARRVALADAFELVARIRPRRERTIESDLEEDR